MLKGSSHRARRCNTLVDVARPRRVAYRHSVYSALPSAQAFCGDLVISPISHRRFMHFAQRHASARTFTCTHYPCLPLPSTRSLHFSRAGASRRPRPRVVESTLLRSDPKSRCRLDAQPLCHSHCHPRGSSSVGRRSQILAQNRVMFRRALGGGTSSSRKETRNSSAHSKLSNSNSRGELG